MLTTNFSSSSFVSTILFGMLFAWLLITAMMTYMAGVRRPSAITGAAEKSLGVPRHEASPEQVATPAASALADEASVSPMAESAPFPLTRGRRADQHVGPETASIAASADSR